MTLAYVCVLIAIFIPILLVGYSKFFSKGYDNRSPREFLDQLHGKAKRANYAQMNAYEVFPPFAAGVIIAHNVGAVQHQIDTLAVLFIVARILYSWAYVSDRPTLRSVFWACSLACIIGFFVISF